MLRCDHCGHVIGVYEPMTMLAGSAPRATSVAAEPWVVSEPGRRYHESCFATGGAEHAQRSR